MSKQIYIEDLEADGKLRRNLNFILKFMHDNVFNDANVNLLNFPLNIKTALQLYQYFLFSSNYDGIDELKIRRFIGFCQSIIINSSLPDAQKTILKEHLFANPLAAESKIKRDNAGISAATLLVAFFINLKLFSDALNDNEKNNASFYMLMNIPIILYGITVSWLALDFNAKAQINVHSSVAHFSAWVNNLALAIEKSQAQTAQIVDIEQPDTESKIDLLADYYKRNPIKYKQ